MKIINKIPKVLCLLCVLMVLQSCSDSLDEHTEVTDPKLKATLAQRIAEDPQLSEFNALLEESGYDEVLNSSKTYTVWAPSNEALAGVPEDILNNSEKLQQFVANHISLAAFTTGMVEDTLKVEMLTKKYMDFLPGSATLAGHNISVADQYASNGIFHVVEQALLPRPNLWEYMMANPEGYEQNDFVEFLNEYDLFHAEGVNAEETDEEVVDTLGVEVDRDSIINELLRTGYYFKNEKKRFTYFVMKNDGFEQEKAKMMPYTQKATQDSTENLAKYYVVRDMIFEGLYEQENLPDTLVSAYGVRVPVNEENIVGEPIEISNGIVYVMKVVGVPLKEKLQPVKLEGEEPIGFSENDKRGNTFYREREDPSGEFFEDIVVQNHGVPQFKIHYNASNMFSTTYKVYWRAINDFEGSFWQHVRIGGGTRVEEDGTITEIEPIAEFGSQEVPPNNYDEVFIGEFTLEEAGDIDLISLIAENTGSNRWNPLTLDYLKLVPIVE